MAVAPKKPEKRPLHKRVEFWQFLAAGLALGILLTTAALRVWPFGTEPPPQGKDPSVFEVLLYDRLMIGLTRVALAAVVVYVVVSVPALVVDRRWMKGLSTAGLAADEARKGDRSIQELQDALSDAQDELEYQVAQNDVISQLLLELEAEGEEDEPPTEGGEPSGTE